MGGFREGLLQLGPSNGFQTDNGCLGHDTPLPAIN
jgi:hypothetical protein